MRVFLTSDSKSGRALIRGVLERQGHVVEEPSELGAGALVAATAWHADAVIAALLTGRSRLERRAAVLVEVGVAVGRNLPTLILAKPGVQLPSLAGVPRIDADPRDADTMALKLDLFLQGVREKSPTKPPASVGKPTRPIPKASLTALTGLELEEAVSRLLEVGGSEFIRDDPLSQKGGADFALNLHGHETDLGMVLIEVKSVANTPEPRRRLREASLQLTEHVHRARAGLGLLVYDGAPIKLPSTPLVAAMSIEELAAQLEQTTLPAVLRRARNQAIHGM